METLLLIGEYVLLTIIIVTVLFLQLLAQMGDLSQWADEKPEVKTAEVKTAEVKTAEVKKPLEKMTFKQTVERAEKAYEIIVNARKTANKINTFKPYIMPIHTINGSTVCTPDKQALKQRVQRLKRELRFNTIRLNQLNKVAQ